MTTIRRLGPYFRPLWRTILLGLLFMGSYALFSGFSIGLVLPIVDKVFVRAAKEPVEPEISVAEGLSRTFSDVAVRLREEPGLAAKVSGAREALEAGWGRLQGGAPALEILAWLCAATLILVLLKNASEFGRKAAFIRVEQAAAESLRRDLFGRILRHPLASFHRTSSGQVVSRLVTDVELVKQHTINTAATFTHNLLQVLVYLTISFWASYRLALVSLLIVPPIAFLTAKIASRLRRHSGHAQARIAELTSSLNETLGAIRIVKGFGTEPQERERFARSSGRYRSSVVRLLTLDSLAAPLSEFWGVVIGVAVLYYGGHLVLDPAGTMTPGRFFVFLIALLSMLHPLKQLASVVTRFQRGVAAADRLFEVLDEPDERDEPDAVPLAGCREEIAFENVSFGYAEGREVLREVSFRAPFGTTTALVGPSGAGKSTLVDLIPRFYDPTRGRITVDGVDLRKLTRESLRAHIGIVSQETLLFNDTVYRNIAYGTEAATRDRVEEAARVANADEFIRAMPLGFDNVIGERGVLLSGGQRQRLAIARAVLRNPEILILDEATSSLDAESESLVQEALDRLLSGRTTFVIAHRLSTVMRADCILVLDEGRIVEWGSHAELVNRPGMYRRLYTLQFQREELPRIDALGR